ncbi:ABC transporter ATP-binding protein [Anaeroselena agilis]|uniref:ABC transporter ATP-binding protein n=1 Tax=Anaeroselena agilis TaxID=3063788 RepID=A0ABU3NVN9_9FIRM|nr:ABC transporter ATP-binding protein [Selenomonadales bacterium 4137-cl]
MDFFRHSHILVPFFRRRWQYYVLGILVLVAVDLLQLAIPRITGKAVDLLVAGDAGIARLLFALTALAVMIAILRYFYRVLIMGTTRHLEFYLREKLFAHTLRLPSVYFDRRGPGQVMALTTNDVTAVRVAVGLGAVLLVDALIMGLASMFVMVEVVNWRLTWQSVVPLPFVLLGTALMGRPIHHRFRTVQEKFSQLTEMVQETFAGARVVKGFAAEPVAIDRFTVASRENVAANLAMARLQAAYFPVTHTAPLFCYAIALYGGGQLIVGGILTVGDLVAFLGYLGLMIWPVTGFSYLVSTVQRGSASLTRIAALLAEPAYETGLPARPAEIPGSSIEIRRLTFHYPDSPSPALSDVSLSIPAGAVVGFVGRTGAGKSTLLKLLLRLYEPPAGAVLIGGRDILSLDFLSLRHGIGYVPQDSFLFARTIGENIAFDRDYRRDDIEKAAGLAAVREAIDDKPFGFGTVLGERGHRLSGGQQQRVAIARALVKAPEILLLDDVFSALDYETQTELLANMKDFRGGRTTIIVSQRIAAVKDADFVVVLDEGAVVEQGSHAELISRGGLYFKLYEQQLVNGELS